MTLLPEDQMKRKRLRATLQISIGHYYLEFLTFCNKHDSGIDLAKLNQKTVVFEEIKVEWPTLEPVENME